MNDQTSREMMTEFQKTSSRIGALGRLGNRAWVAPFLAAALLKPVVT
jgi:hypothetical protein